jgi:radical SAM protein with 4Fe4S-binding SPASM domain
MNQDQLVEFLNNKYSVKGVVDLAELSESPGTAYQFFYKIYQTNFESNDRIVLYTSQEIPDDFLRHLIQTVNFADISNWFILICTPLDISQQLVDSVQKYSSDSVVFKNFKVDLEQTKSFKNSYHLPDTICAIPWMNLEIRSNGMITPCCLTRGLSLGNIKHNTLIDAFDNDAVKKLRHELRSGERPEVCNRCWYPESNGVSSNRTRNFERLKKQFLLNYLDKPAVVSLDLRFNNTCNFKCRICNSDRSSLFAAEENKFLGVKIAPQQNWSESDQFLDQVIDKLPELTNLDMTGGEPFLIKKFANVLHMAVEQGHAKNIRLHYNSNGSVWPEELITHWPYFKEVNIHFSIDAIGKRFELERGGSWQAVEQNILRIKNLKLPNMTFTISPAVSIMNAYYIDEVYDWAQKHNFQLLVGYVTFPKEFDLKNLTKEAQQLIFDKFQNHPEIEIQNMLALISSAQPTENKAFVKRIKWFDSVRQENFADSHPEIANAMGYVYNKNS